MGLTETERLETLALGIKPLLVKRLLPLLLARLMVLLAK
jgi:hypothetical protein